MRTATLLLLLALQCQAASPVRDLLKKPGTWFQSDEGLTVTSNVLAWQTNHGDWPKNRDTTSALSEKDKASRGTFDNSATTTELRFLAKAYTATKVPETKRAFLRGLEHILMAQYKNGGWPQRAPGAKGYDRHITFNDGTIIYLLEFLQAVATEDTYAFVSQKQRTQADEVIKRGISCILACQIVIEGKRTVWCAQHHRDTLAPVGARSYELPSFSGGESAGILSFLMKLPSPSPEVSEAIKAGVQWFESSKITGIRLEKRDNDRVVVEDKNAPPLWGRFYDLETQRPFFCGRDGVKKASLAEIEHERRNGYRWYGTWGTRLAKALEARQAG